MPIFFLADKWKCIYFHDAVFKDDYEPAFFEGLKVKKAFREKKQIGQTVKGEINPAFRGVKHPKTEQITQCEYSHVIRNAP